MRTRRMLIATTIAPTLARTTAAPAHERGTAGEASGVDAVAERARNVGPEQAVDMLANRDGRVGVALNR